MLFLGIIIGAGLFGLLETILTQKSMRNQFRADERSDGQSRE